MGASYGRIPAVQNEGSANKQAVPPAAQSGYGPDQAWRDYGAIVTQVGSEMQPSSVLTIAYQLIHRMIPSGTVGMSGLAISSATGLSLPTVRRGLKVLIDARLLAHDPGGAIRGGRRTANTYWPGPALSRPGAEGRTSVADDMGLDGTGVAHDSVSPLTHLADEPGWPAACVTHETDRGRQVRADRSAFECEAHSQQGAGGSDMPAHNEAHLSELPGSQMIPSTSTLSLNRSTGSVGYTNNRQPPRWHHGLSVFNERDEQVVADLVASYGEEKVEEAARASREKNEKGHPVSFPSKARRWLQRKCGVQQGAIREELHGLIVEGDRDRGQIKELVAEFGVPAVERAASEVQKEHGAAYVSRARARLNEKRLPSPQAGVKAPRNCVDRPAKPLPIEVSAERLLEVRASMCI